MNKIILIGALILVVLVGMVMSGCGNGDENGLPKAVEAQMRQDWIEQFGSPLRFDAYYGTFNGAVVIFIAGDAAWMKTETIAGVIFEYTTLWYIYVWSENVFVTLYEAYQENILTQENIIKIGETHYKTHQNICNPNLIKIGETYNKNTTK